MPIARARDHKTSEACPIFSARSFCQVEKEPLDLQILSRIDEPMKNLQ